MNIPLYPTFKPLDINDFDVFSKAFDDTPPLISEFTFTNLYAWRDTYKFSVSKLDNFIILRSDSHEGPRYFMPIGKGDVKTAIERIAKDAPVIFIRIPEQVKVSLSHDERFIAESDESNSDYLYKAKDLSELPGRKYDGKRNLIKQFKSKYKYEYIKLDASDCCQCLEFEERWCTIKNCDSNEGLSNERKAIKEISANFSLFQITGGAIKVEGKICAVALGQRLNPDTLVVHILKADPDMQGLYQVINNEFCVHESGGFEYINLEQDLGVEGIRKSKLSYHPFDIIKKYTLKTTW